MLNVLKKLNNLINHLLIWILTKQKYFQKSLSEEFDTTDIDKGIDCVYSKGRATFTITTPSNQRNNKNNNMTRIDLGECETKLRNFYNIPDNEPIYMKKIDIIQDDMNTLKVEYDVYAKLSGIKLTKLNLSIC